MGNELGAPESKSEAADVARLSLNSARQSGLAECPGRRAFVLIRPSRRARDGRWAGSLERNTKDIIVEKYESTRLSPNYPRESSATTECSTPLRPAVSAESHKDSSPLRPADKRPSAAAATADYNYCGQPEFA